MKSQIIINRIVICAFLLTLFYAYEIIPMTQDTANTAIGVEEDSLAGSVLSLSESTDKQKTENVDFSFKKLVDLIDLDTILIILIILVAGYYILKLIRRVLLYFAKKIPRYRNIFEGLIPISWLMGWIIIIYLILVVTIHLPPDALIAIVAALVLAIGFAGQDLFKNIFGGILILFEKPFQVGDMIQVGEHYGKVTAITLRTTRIVTEGNTSVMIPNSEIMIKSVVNSNYSGPNAQVTAEIFLPVGVDTTRAREIALEAAKVSRYIHLKKPVSVLFVNEVKGRKAYLKMCLRAYVNDVNYENIFRSEMTEIVIRELLREGLLTRDSTI